jgi:hypothetical protein
MTLASLPRFEAPRMLASGSRESRRLATRREVLLPCQCVREHDFKLISDRTLDVSVDGMLLPVKEEILTGEPLIVSFPIPGIWIDAEASVSRVIHNRRPGDDGLAIGITFDVISPTARAALAAYLHGRPPPLPRRGPLARMRRGEPAPILADQALMDRPIPSPVYALDDDILDDDALDEVDAASVLRALVGAWQSLVATPAD